MNVDYGLSLNTFRLGDVASFACHDDQQLGFFSTENTPVVLDTITNGIVYEPVARSRGVARIFVRGVLS